MIKRIAILGMTCIMLIGSVVFPLGDFSLTRDLPEMYRNYSKITTPEELGVIDFIGDYLLHGKQIFGHNERDKQQSQGNGVQFQHQPVPFHVVLTPVPLFKINMAASHIAHSDFYLTTNTSDFKNKLFRPPLA